MKRFFALIFLFTTITLVLAKISFADTVQSQETMEGVIIQVTKQTDTYQQLQVLITKGSLKDKTVTADGGLDNSSNKTVYKVRDHVMILRTIGEDGNNIFYVTDYVRRGAIYIAFAIFVLLALAVSKLRGLTSILGMVISFVVIFTFVLPKISAGANPTLIAIIASIFIVPITFYFSHGINKKTTCAIVGTYISLVIIGIISLIFVNFTKLTGYGSDDAMFLSIVKQGAINIRGVMLAGIIVGALGILNDITISQASVVFQLFEASKGELNTIEIYKSAMKVGQDHIASMINTLVLVYAGASLPLLLLFVNSPLPASQVINYEIIASEIVKTVVGSIGLILAVPITTVIACLAVDFWGLDKNDRGHKHVHTH